MKNTVYFNSCEYILKDESRQYQMFIGVPWRRVTVPYIWEMHTSKVEAEAKKNLTSMAMIYGSVHEQRDIITQFEQINDQWKIMTSHILPGGMPGPL